MTRGSLRQRGSKLAGHRPVAVIRPRPRGARLRAVRVRGGAAAHRLRAHCSPRTPSPTSSRWRSLGIYGSFQMVVPAALRARLKGWRPAGEFTLGRWGLPVNIGALAYGIFAIVNICWARSPEKPWCENWIVLRCGAVRWWWVPACCTCSPPTTTAATTRPPVARCRRTRPYRRTDVSGQRRSSAFRVARASRWTGRRDRGAGPDRSSHHSRSSRRVAASPGRPADSRCSAKVSASRR